MYYERGYRMNEPEEIHRPRTSEEQKAELLECISAGDFRTSQECVLSGGTEPSILRMILREVRKINPGKAREFAAELRYHANGLVRELAGKILKSEQAEIEETTGIYLSPDIAASFDKIEKKINGSERPSAGIREPGKVKNSNSTLWLKRIWKNMKIQL